VLAEKVIGETKTQILKRAVNLSKEDRKVELHEYIKFIKAEVKKSEDEKPKEGFWIGAQSLEISFQTTTEVSKEGGLKIYFLSAKGEKIQQEIQTVKINLITQEFRPKSVDAWSLGKRTN
jgi:hypothetical protein